MTKPAKKTSPDCVPVAAVAAVVAAVVAAAVVGEKADPFAFAFQKHCVQRDTVDQAVARAAALVAEAARVVVVVGAPFCRFHFQQWRPHHQVEESPFR